jgi:hypothetical protein
LATDQVLERDVGEICQRHGAHRVEIDRSAVAIQADAEQAEQLPEDPVLARPGEAQHEPLEPRAMAMGAQQAKQRQVQRAQQRSGA